MGFRLADTKDMFQPWLQLHISGRCRGYMGSYQKATWLYIRSVVLRLFGFQVSTAVRVVKLLSGACRKR